jgi:hypothetical protein
MPPPMGAGAVSQARPTRRAPIQRAWLGGMVEAGDVRPRGPALMLEQLATLGWWATFLLALKMVTAYLATVVVLFIAGFILFAIFDSLVKR